MAEKIHPSKPNSPPTATPAASTPTATAVNGSTNKTNPTTLQNKPQIRRPPVYRYNPSAKHRRGCCCRCCCWTIFLLIILILLTAAAATVLYFIYRPQRPTFTVNSLRLSSLNITSSSHLTAHLNLTVTARNPNRELVFRYDQIDISVLTSNNDIQIIEGSLPGFVHGKRNATTLRSVMQSNNVVIYDNNAVVLSREMKRRNGMPLKVVIDTKVKAEMGALKSPKVGVRVTCNGIRVTASEGKKVAVAETSNAKCKADLRIKIWRWTF